MQVYVAGPMRCKPEFNFPAFDSAAKRLRAAGHEVVSPAEMDRLAGFDPKGKSGFEPVPADQLCTMFARDCDAVCRVDAVAVLPGWQGSMGAKIEVSIAKLLGKKILDAETGEALTEEPVCEEAARITTQDRRDVYGHPFDDFRRIAGQWSAVLGVKVTPEQVALCMIQVKIGRLCHSPDHRDSMVDIAGYANCLDMIRRRRNEITESYHKGE